MGKFIINGNLNIARISVDNGGLPDEGNITEYLNDITSMNDNMWDEDSVILANMNNSLSGNGQDYQFQNIKRFKVYKTIGNSNPKLYEVYETKSPTERIVEDFLVGDKCDYKYYLHPICAENDSGGETISQPISSETTSLNLGIVSVMGLIKVEGSEDEYVIDTENIWKFGFNITDDGYTLNTNKTFSDTHNRYQQMTGSYRAYKTKPITALLGDFDCATKEFIDTFEKLEAWDEFCRDCNLKVMIDLRGRIYIGDIDNNPNVNYENDGTREASVSFSFRELTDIDNVKILGRAINKEGE